MLTEILAHKRTELAQLRTLALPEPPPRRAIELRRASVGSLSLIAEIKRRSPSAGQLSTLLTVEQRAQAYQAAGARLISVLCDNKYFDGSYEFLARARAACSLPLLCKEFVVDEIQLDVARAYGADAVLLIVRCLSQERLGQLLHAARDRNLEALVEIHAPDEARRALDVGATWIGVNARDLETLEMNADQARTVLGNLPAHVCRAHLSGVHTEADIVRVAKSPADAALIGETLMRQDEPTALLRKLVAAAQHA